MHMARVVQRAADTAMSARDDSMAWQVSISVTDYGKTLRPITEVMSEWGKRHMRRSNTNSIAIIMKHVAGNLTSRLTDFLTTDGEKPDRNRDGEFIDTFLILLR